MMANAEISQQRARKLEATYVHDVYSRKALSYDNLCDGPWPEIRTFLLSLPSGSHVADVGCGNGKYLNVREDIVINGSDICKELVQLAYGRHRDVIRANNLRLPYRSESIDAVISVGVLHHFASPNRRLQSVWELVRLLRPGGKLLIYVWAWEQKQRKFGAQDVLVPWSKSKRKGSCGKRTKKANGDQFAQSFPQNRNCFNNQLNKGMKNDHSSLLTQERGCLATFSSDESTQLDISFDDMQNLSVNGDGTFRENRETKLKTSSIKTSVSETVVTIKEKLQQFSFAKLKKTSDGNKIESSSPNSQQNGSQSYLRGKNEHYERNGEKEEWYSNLNFQMKCEYRSLPEYGDQNTGLKNKTGFSKKTSELVGNEKCNNEDSVTSLQMPRFRRFYHVFRKDELLDLVKCVPELKVVSQYYDHGNWALIAEKQLDNKIGCQI